MSNSDPLAEKVYVELVRSLYANVLPSKIMLGITVTCVALIGRRMQDGALWAIGFAAVAACVVRLGVVLLRRNRAMTAALDRAAARSLELAFAGPYYVYSALLGGFGACAFMTRSGPVEVLTICMLVGYCAGVATGTGLRPRIAIPSMAMALCPALLVSAARMEAIYVGLSAIATAFLIGGIQTLLTKHRRARTEVGQRLTSVSLARRDGLTALPNRLALREYFEENAMLLGPGGVIAVHYLDLDGFKPVNDRFGHATGDELLAAVAQRLRGAVRSGDIVARLGGDEFGIVQFGLNRIEEADLLARRLVSAIAQPFVLGDRTIGISASIGTAVSSENASDLDALLRSADARLYESKRSRANAGLPPEPAR